MSVFPFVPDNRNRTMHRRHNLFKQLFLDMSQMCNICSTCMRERYIHGEKHVIVLPMRPIESFLLSRDKRTREGPIICHAMLRRMSRVLASCIATCRSPLCARTETCRCKGQQKASQSAAKGVARA